MKKDRGVAILLALLLGGLGIQKFYLNQIGWGVLSLIFFWTFIPAIAGFVDGIRWAVMGEEEFQSRYSKIS